MPAHQGSLHVSAGAGETLTIGGSELCEGMRGGEPTGLYPQADPDSSGLKELRESRVWMRLIVRAELLPEERMAGLLDEADQLCNIIAQSILTAKQTTKETERTAETLVHLETCIHQFAIPAPVKPLGEAVRWDRRNAVLQAHGASHRVRASPVRPAPSEPRQGRKAAAVGGRSGAIRVACPFSFPPDRKAASLRRRRWRHVPPMFRRMGGRSFAGVITSAGSHFLDRCCETTLAREATWMFW